MSAPAAPGTRRGPGRAIRWLLAVQVAIAGLLIGGDFLRLLPELIPRDDSAPPLDTEVRPGDQTRRYAPRFTLPGVPGDRGFPSSDVPSRLTWQPAQIDGAPGLLLTGEIQPGDAARFATHLDARESPPATIALHSPGGSVLDAVEIGARIREGGIATRVSAGRACFSACPYALAGGTTRTISRGARVGVHQHFFDENAVLPAFMAVEGIQRGQAEVMAHLDAMGVDPLLMEKAMRTPREDIYILVEDELTGFALATEMVD